MNTLAITLVLAALSPSVAPFESPLPVQGALQNAAGAVTDGQYKLKLSLYAAADGSNALWSEVHNAVAVTDGVFAVRLGEIEALPATLLVDNHALWVGVSVENEPELPRQSLAPVAWAHVAGYAHASGTATALACTGCIGAGQLAAGAVGSDAISALDWAKLTNVPAGFQDGKDDAGLTGAGPSGSLAVFDGAGGLTSTSVISLAGTDVGIGVDAPAVKLDVGGAVRLGTTDAVCVPALGGALRFNAASKQIEYCDTTAWRAVGLSFDGLARSLVVNNPNAGAVTGFQLKVDVSAFTSVYGALFVVTDPSGAAVPYCFEQPGGECGVLPSTVVWLRLTSAAGAKTTTFTFQKSAVGAARPPSEVFDFYEDFNQPLDLSRWQVATDTCSPTVSGGLLRAGAANANNRECGVMSSAALLADGKTLEARVSIGGSTTLDCDAALMAVRSDFTTLADHTSVMSGWYTDDETPSQTLSYGAKATQIFATSPMLNTTQVVSLNLQGGQIKACQTIDGACSSFQTRGGADRDRVFVGSIAYGGNPLTFDWVWIRKYADSPLTAAWAP